VTLSYTDERSGPSGSPFTPAILDPDTRCDREQFDFKVAQL
jgi:hypothetical protein